MSDNIIDLQKNQAKFERSSDDYRKETNEISRELARQLMLAATVLLSISVFIFNSDFILGKLTSIDKHFLSFSWISLGCVIIFGIWQLKIDYEYFKKWTLSKFNVSRGIYTGEINKDNISNKVIEYQKDIPTESAVWPTNLQIFFLLLGIGLIVFIMISLLFS